LSCNIPIKAKAVALFQVGKNNTAYRFSRLSTVAGEHSQRFAKEPASLAISGWFWFCLYDCVRQIGDDGNCFGFASIYFFMKSSNIFVILLLFFYFSSYFLLVLFCLLFFMIIL